MKHSIFRVEKGEEIRIDESAWSTCKRDGFAYFDDAGKLHMLPELGPIKPAEKTMFGRVWERIKLVIKA